MLQILIADDHEVVRRGLKQIIQEEFPFARIDEANDTSSLVSKAIAADWDIILSDLAMPGGGGLEAVRQIREQKINTPILIISIYPEDQYAVRVIKSGASGYLNKDAAPEELVNAVKRILAGKRHISETVAEALSSSLHLAGERPLHELLTEREYYVFKLLVTGKPIAIIADELSIATTTASTYRSRILTKMNLKSNAALIHYAVENGLI
ncbi:MAG: response regulator transcription factor [Bacteroidota bacterium]|nr:response regulator transcription factor [Bacteroidota bacterium]